MSKQKRPPSLPTWAWVGHQMWSKSTIHEALFDLWLEHQGLDLDLDQPVPEAVQRAYWIDVERRARLTQERQLKPYPAVHMPLPLPRCACGRLMRSVQERVHKDGCLRCQLRAATKEVPHA